MAFSGPACANAYGPHAGIFPVVFPKAHAGPCGPCDDNTGMSYLNTATNCKTLQ